MSCQPPFGYNKSDGGFAMNGKWWKNSVVYQIYPKTFKDGNGDGTGDLKGITEKLDYIKNLGVDAIWLSPVFDSPGMDNGYDVSDYRKINPLFGSMEDFEKLVDGVHGRGMKIILDMVANHTSDKHRWFEESKKSKDNPYSDYYIWRDGKNGSPPNNWGAIFGGSAWTYYPERKQYCFNLFSPYQPDLNWKNEKVRREMKEAMLFWLEKGVDGFRLDAIGYIVKPDEFTDGIPCEEGYAFPETANLEPIHEYLQELRKEVFDKYDLLVMGENSFTTVEEAAKYAPLDGSELDMMIAFDHVDLDCKNGKWNCDKISIPELNETFANRQTGTHGKAWNTLYWCNHDQPRVVSRLGSEKADYRERSAKMIAVNLHFMQGTPLVYQGEELGMTNMKFTSRDQLNDIESIHAFDMLVKTGASEEKAFAFLNCKSRDNARTVMQWSAQKNAGFTSGETEITVNPNYTEINAGEQEGREDSVYNFYRRLIALRKEKSVITDGAFKALESDIRVISYVRENEEEKLIVVCNFSRNKAEFDYSSHINPEETVISNCHGSEYLKSKLLAPYEAIVLSERKYNSGKE